MNLFFLYIKNRDTEGGGILRKNRSKITAIFIVEIVGLV